MVAEAEAETNGPTTIAAAAGGGAPVANGKTDGAEKTASAGASKRVGGGKGLNAVLTDDEIKSTLAAASEKLQAAHKRDLKAREKKKKGAARCFGALYPKRFFAKLRDFYINSCMIAAEKGDFVDIVGAHQGIYYGETVMSRNVSQRRDEEHEEMLQASLSRQVSISLSRQLSQQDRSGALKMTRNTSTGIPGLSRSGSKGFAGLHRNASTGMPGLNRQSSSGMPGLNRNTSTGIIGLNRHTANGRSTFGRSPSSRKVAESNLFTGGREKFLQDLAAETPTSKGGQVDSNQNGKVATAPEPDVSKPGNGEALAGAAVKAGETKMPVQ